MIAVTVVVPTYRSSAHLDDLVASLDAQTLPQSDFEVVLVDDGSPDGTFARLEAFARDRPNYRAFRLEHTGWPSRPRNHGIDVANGRYVVFLDHDDRLFPDGLRAAVALASRTGADVLDGKESKSDSPGWAMRDLVRDVDNAIDWVRSHPLVPMNPHKMFRTAFLREQGIRFPEGGRQIWEDIFFDIAAHARAQVVSLMVETPFYYWNRPEHATTSGTFYDDLDEYLDAVARVFRWIDDELDQPRFAQLLPRFRAYQLHMRVLPLFRWDPRTVRERDRICAFVAGLLPTIPDDADRFLDPWRRIKMSLLRAGRFDLIDAHERTFPMLACAPTAHAPQWAADGLRVEVALAWSFVHDGAGADGGAGAPVRCEGARAVLALDSAVAAFAREHGLRADVTDELRAVTYALDRRSRTQKIDWMLAHGRSAELGAVDGDRDAVRGTPVAMRGRIGAAWDLVDDGPGRLHDGPWDLYVRTTAMRTRVVRQVRTTWTGRSWAIVQGQLAAAYRARNGALSVDVGQTLFSVVDDAATAASWKHDGAGRKLEITLPHVQVHADCVAEGRFVDASGHTLGGCRLVARVSAAGGEGEAKVTGIVPAHARIVGVAFGATRAHARFRLARDGRVAVVPAAERAPVLSIRGAARRAWRLVPSRLRTRLWLWRHRRR